MNYKCTKFLLSIIFLLNNYTFGWHLRDFSMDATTRTTIRALLDPTLNNECPDEILDSDYDRQGNPTSYVYNNRKCACEALFEVFYCINDGGNTRKCRSNLWQENDSYAEGLEKKLEVYMNNLDIELKEQIIEKTIATLRSHKIADAASPSE